MKKQWILAGLLVGMLTAVAGCNVGGEQSTSSVQTPPASESSAVVSSEEMSFESVENSADNSVESGENNSESTSDSTPEIPYYTVQFDTDGGSEVASVQVKEGDKIEIPETPKKSSMEAEYEFIGWYYGETEWDFDNDIVTQDMVLTAKWKALESYTPPFLPKD